jgi:formamidopyrimidine-DNA glycosylase
MPELPEVETVRRGLLNKVKGRTITGSVVRWPGIIAYPDKDEFGGEIANQTINDILRRGKILIFELDDYYLTSHLRMEGKYFIKDKEEPLSKHDHVIFILDNNQELRYNDTRKFGKMHLVKKDELSKTPVGALGKEPWDNDLTTSYLKDKLNRRLPIKTLLLDQSIITGIGNIYADEVLFLSKIHPETKGCHLTNKNMQDIIKNTRAILSHAIELGGTTIHTYTAVDGVTGRFQQELLVHGKKDMPCPKCKTKIVKCVVGTRGTYYCPKCQKPFIDK